MTDKTPLETGLFCWVDVAVADTTEIHKFFSQLFGWSRRVRPTDDNEAYWIMTNGGDHVAGICAVEEAGPSQWMAYLLVKELQQAEEAAVRLGGTVLKSGVEIKSFGTLSVLEDPTGAVFAIWQATRPEYKKPRVHGNVSWYELASRAPEKAREFYSQLARWEVTETTYDEAPYTIFQRDGGEVAGLRACKEGEFPSWNIYFAVDNVDETAALCPTLGGTVELPPFDVPGLGRCSMLKDPSGGYFGIFQYS